MQDPDQPFVWYYPLPDGRRLVLIERLDGMAVTYGQRPALRIPNRWVRDRSIATELHRSCEAAHEAARLAGGDAPDAGAGREGEDVRAGDRGGSRPAPR